MTSTPDDLEPFADVEAPPAPEAPPFAEPDPSLFEAHELARAALLEITPAQTVGAPLGHTVEADGVVSLHFATTLEGYPGWHWTVAVARVGGDEPTVLEVELLPGEGALLAPDWLPWAERLAEYQAAAERSLAEAGDEGDDDGDADLDELDELDDLDAADFDEDGSPILHAGDLDGVDIDVLDEDAEDDDVLDEETQDDDAVDDDDEPIGQFPN